LTVRPLKVDEEFFVNVFQKTYTPYSIIKEFVGDAYEADAEKVFIDALEDGTLIIRDEGKYAGMTDEDVEAFLTLGTARKRYKNYTDHYKRPISGRHGVGRFSFLTLYKQLNVENEKDMARTSFAITDEMLKRVARGESTLVDIQPMTPTGVNGTAFAFKELINESAKLTPADIRRYVESNFIVLLTRPVGPFSIYVNGVKVEPKKLPKETQVYNINEKVGNVVVKGHRMAECEVTGYIAISRQRLPPEQRGIQLTVGGTPIGRRRSLGEILGDRNVDSHFPFDNTTGAVEAPFLVPKLSRDDVETGDASYVKFRNVMLKVAKRLKVKEREREEQEVEAVKSMAILGVQKEFEEVIRKLPELWSIGGITSQDAAGPDGTTVEVQVPLKEDKTAADVQGQREESRHELRKKEKPKSMKQVIRVYTSVEGGTKTVRRIRSVKAAGFNICYEKMPGSMAPSISTPTTKGIVINEAHPCFERRLKNLKHLKSYVLRLVVKEAAKIIENLGLTREDADSLYGTLLNAADLVTDEPVA
jgi:hypothetical protein